MIIKELNHVAIAVENVKRSVEFYQKVLQLPQLARPDFDFQGAWFKLGGYQELHIIEGRTKPVVNDRRGAHFALSVDSISEFKTQLDKYNVIYHPPKKRPDGVLQLFLIDPDGYFIELAEN
jgi:catechol 2,3-dioxygenase-like lactoylglutathione lyase family enzyme